MRKRKNRCGLSLVEMIIAFAIIVIIFAAIVPQFRAIRNSWSGTEARAEIIQNGRVLAEHITRNLAAAKQIVSVSPSGSITFQDNNDVTKCYMLSSGYVVFGNVGSEEQLAGPVSRFQINCYSINPDVTPTTDVNAIRLVRFETDFPNADVPGANKTFSSEVFIQTNAQAQAISRGAAFELSKGTPYEFDTSNGQYPALAQIDSTHYLCAYTDTGSIGYAVVLTVNLTTRDITAGTPCSFELPAAAGTYPALAKIDSTHYLCAYTGAGTDGWAVVLTVNLGTWAVTRNTPYEFDNSNGQYPALVQINSTHYLCAYTDTGSIGYAVVLTVSPTWTITAGTPRSFELPAAAGTYPALAQIDSTHYLCAYTGAGTDGYAVVLTVNLGTWAISRGTAFEYDTSNGQYPALAQIDSTHYLCAYTDTGNLGYAVVLTVSPTWTITRGAPYSFEMPATAGLWPALAQIDTTRYLCAYYRNTSGNPGYAVVLTVSGTTITPNTPYQFDGTGLYPALAKIDICNYLCAYTGSGDDGWSVVLQNRPRP